MLTVVVSAIAIETNKTGITTNGEPVNAFYFKFFLFDIWQNVHNIKTILNLVSGTKYMSLIMCPPLSFIFRTFSSSIPETTHKTVTPHCRWKFLFHLVP